MYTLSGEPQDRHVVIVDDLVQTGGTLIQCAKVRWSLLPSCVGKCVMRNAYFQCVDFQHLPGSPCFVFQLCSCHVKFGPFKIHSPRNKYFRTTTKCLDLPWKNCSPFPCMEVYHRTKLKSYLFNLCRLWVDVLCPFKSWCGICSHTTMPEATTVPSAPDSVAWRLSRHG